MAFSGAATVKVVSDGVVRITGLSLLGGQSGTIALSEYTGGAVGVRLPAQFMPRVYDVVTMQDSIQVEAIDVSAIDTEAPLVIVKTGTSPTDFLITLRNAAAGEGPSSNFELYVRFH